MKIRVLPVMIAAVLSFGSAQAAPAPAAAPAAAPVAQTAQQQAARAEIDRLVGRIQELSKQLGEGNDVRVIVRRERQGGPMARGELDDDDVAMAGGGDGDGERHIVIRRIGPDGKSIEDMGPGMRMDEGGPGQRKIRIERMGPGMGPGMGGMPGGDEMFKQGPGLGIVMAPNPAASGVRVAAVTPDSPAARAGLRSGDVILSVDGKPVTGNGPAAVGTARDLLGDLKMGQSVTLRYAREGKTHDASMKADAIRRVMMFNRDDVAPMARMHGGDGGEHWKQMMPPGVEMEIERIGPRGGCDKGEPDCGMPAIYQAFRWQGLNLSSIDPGLGRYFGTDKGVLVLSSGEDLKGLQSGDVIQRVAGKPVESPRDVMRALREKDAGAQLQFDVLRDRRSSAVTVTVPKSRPLPFMAPPPPPPAPPAPPAPPSAPRAPGAAPPAPPAPPPPPRPLGWNDDGVGGQARTIERVATLGDGQDGGDGDGGDAGDAVVQLVLVPGR